MNLYKLVLYLRNCGKFKVFFKKNNVCKFKFAKFLIKILFDLYDKSEFLMPQFLLQL